MNENIVNDGENTSTEEGTKTFSQDDVNRIVSERLSKEKSKLEAATAQREQELAQRELMLTAKERISELGLPPEVYEAINIADAEALEKSLTILKETFNNAKPDTLKISGAKPASSTGGAPNTSVPLLDAFGLGGRA